MTAKKNQGKGSKPLNKTSFIKSFADDVSADEIVAKAKDAGLELSKKLIWTVQSEVRHSGKNGASKVTKAPKVTPVSKAKPVKKPPAKALRAAAASKSAAAKRSAKGARRPANTSSSAAGARSSAEQKMTAILIELGTARADELYRSVRSKLHALVN